MATKHIKGCPTSLFMGKCKLKLQGDGTTHQAGRGKFFKIYNTKNEQECGIAKFHDCY